ncbi:MAG: DinB family protein [Gemmatimonadales bacterium]
MSVTESGVASEVAIFRHQAGVVSEVVRINVNGVTHEESLIRPAPAGNCLNWVVGHLLAVYGNALALLGQERVLEEEVLKRYDRGSPPIENPADALEFSELMKAWDETSRRIDSGLAALTPETLDQPAADSPSGNPDETVRTLVSTIMFHQAYHAGQLGVLRRIAGREGAIA